MMTTTKRALATLMPWSMLLSVAGCGSGVPPRSPALDPSNPDGAESAPLSAWAASQEPPVPSGTPIAAGSADAAQVYSCPMHPEVQSSQPGKCPKCGMNLTVRKGNP
jgi:hypothetical protein